MKTQTNDLLKTYSGIFGNQVVLQNRRGRIIMTIRPPKRVPEPSDKQLAWRRMFQLGSHYAGNILKDPEMLAAYRAKARRGQTPYNMALRDFLRPPFVSKIDASDYHGNPGEKISVAAADDFGLSEVTVQIVDTDGVTIEQGACVFSLPTGNYDYTATVPVPDPAGVTILSKARDIPGHVAKLAITLP
jgi:hypothetical protein